jgi:hypothetical protein
LGNYGRFGNQLFQIAATTALALENNDTAVFPNWQYNEYFSVGIKTDIIENFKISRDYQEHMFSYQKIPYVDGINLIGYFQSEKYFKDYENEIKNLFKLKEEYEIELKNKWKEELKNSVSIHVRRDDYISPVGIDSIIFSHGVDYFIPALKYVETKNKIDNVLVFSDDIQWCKNNFNDPRCIFIENQTNVFDMFLMSYCNHNITTNSTFSWWGSWLNKNKEKTVTIPRNWFNPKRCINTSDLYRNDMIII